MRYGCDDIKYYLENSEIGPHDETEFLRHIENCGECNRLIDLTPDLERLIYMSSPKPSPLSFEKDILIELNRYEAELSGEGVWEKVETRGSSPFGSGRISGPCSDLWISGRLLQGCDRWRRKSRLRQ